MRQEPQDQLGSLRRLKAGSGGLQLTSVDRQQGARIRRQIKLDRSDRTTWGRLGLHHLASTRMGRQNMIESEQGSLGLLIVV